MNARTHLAEALHWSTETEVELAEVLATGLGMAGPVLLAAAMGQISLGLVLGGNWISSELSGTRP